MGQFSFLQREWPTVFGAAAKAKAEAAVRVDPRTACFYARRALEIAVAWAYKHDPALRLPYQDNLSALIHEPSFKDTAGEAVFNKARVIVTLGNRAVHSHRPIVEADAVAAVRELFHVRYWFARAYGQATRPDLRMTFSTAALSKPAPTATQTAEQLQALQTQRKRAADTLAVTCDCSYASGSRVSMSRALVVGSRVSTPVSQAWGSMPLALAVAIRLMITAARLPAVSEPANSQAGARASANLYSLIETAKANGLNPQSYLERVFTDLSNVTTVADYEALLPWHVADSSSAIAPAQ